MIQPGNLDIGAAKGQNPVFGHRHHLYPEGKVDPPLPHREFDDSIEPRDGRTATRIVLRDHLGRHPFHTIGAIVKIYCIGLGHVSHSDDHG
jgi:hypothetical protein